MLSKPHWNSLQPDFRFIFIAFLNTVSSNPLSKRNAGRQMTFFGQGYQRSWDPLGRRRKQNITYFNKGAKGKGRRVHSCKTEGKMTDKAEVPQGMSSYCLFHVLVIFQLIGF